MSSSTRFLLILLGISVIIVPLILWSLFSNQGQNEIRNIGLPQDQISISPRPSTQSGKVNEADSSTRSASPSLGR